MRFKIDENLPIEIVELLIRQHHDAASVPAQQMSGQSDRRIARLCQVEGRSLVTLDLDFSDIRAYPPGQYSGIIVLRPKLQNTSMLVRMMDRVINLLDREMLEGTLWVVDDHQVRIRQSSNEDL